MPGPYLKRYQSPNLEPGNQAPDNPKEGDIYYDGLLKKLRVYDGTAWKDSW
jgi:hypothetical protein